jgi:hypothetical protein
VKVLYAMLCEDAQPRNDGRMDIHGVFTQLYAPGFPAKQDHMVLVTTVEWEPAERGQIHFAIDLLDPDRSPVGTINGSSEVGDLPALSGPPQTRLVMPLDGVIFPQEGTYEFELKVGEERQVVARLHLIENPALRGS